MRTYSSNINGITFSVCVEESLYPQVQTLFQVIKNIPPENIKNGYKIEIGFSVFILIKNGNDYCIVVPDYTRSPFYDNTEDLTIALWVQLEQTELLRLYNVEGEAVRFDDEIIVAENAFQDNLISMQRFSDFGKGVSGWCIERIEKSDDGQFHNLSTIEYKSYYVYQLLKIRPALIKALVLPYGFIVVFEGDNIIEILNEQNDSIIG